MSQVHSPSTDAQQGLPAISDPAAVAQDQCGAMAKGASLGAGSGATLGKALYCWILHELMSLWRSVWLQLDPATRLNIAHWQFGVCELAAASQPANQLANAGFI